MLPKNSKHFIQPAAEELDISSEIVQDVITFYYQELRSSLSNLDFYNFQIENLGMFKAKSNELPKLYMKYKGHLEVMKEPRTFQEMTIKKETEIRFNKVKALQEAIKEEKKRKSLFIKKKNETIQDNEK